MALKLFYSFFLCTIFLFPQKNNQKKVSGHILEIQSNLPIENCIVGLTDLKYQNNQLSLSNKNGYFEFYVNPKSVIQIKVKRLGYDGTTNETINMGVFDSLKLNIVLTPISFLTDSVVISEDKILRTLAETGFYERKKKGFGFYLTYKDLEKHRIQNFKQIISIIPDLKTSSTSQVISNYSTPGLNGKNEVHIYLDGIKIDNYSNSEGWNNVVSGEVNIANIVDPDNIAGIEFYKHAVEVPLKFKTFDSTGGVLLIWTK